VPRSEPKTVESRESRVESPALPAEIPLAVAERLHAKLRCTIGPDGHRAEVADAINGLSGQVHILIAAQANTIGEERRLVKP
jgi:hypothetical protein